MSETDQKLNSALEKNRASRIRSSWTASLSQACGMEIAPEYFLSLKETTALKEAFWSKVRGKGCPRRFYSKKNFEQIESGLKAITNGQLTSVLFSSVDKYIGAVRLPASVVFNHIQSIWKVTEEDFCVATPDLQNGICLEFNYYDERGDFIKEGVYELSLWGDFSSNFSP